ncbi:hypothetical protein [Rhodoluna sp.]|uniref:hypothetical protein n=1 Tax=Rhodoluna sp. TaxID=1969481 RepID=UPI0025E06B91|nr:hypothetical protein [Rhodoluna sp.]
MAVAFKIEETFQVELARMYTVLSDVASWSVFDKPRLVSAKNGKITLAFVDGTRAFIDFMIVDAGVAIRVVHELLKDESAISAYQKYWNEVFVGIRRRLEIA